MNRLNELADNMERGEYDVAAHKEAVALLRAAAAEQVGTEWVPNNRPRTSDMDRVDHIRDLGSIRPAQREPDKPDGTEGGSTAAAGEGGAA